MKRICVLILVLLWAWSVVGNNQVPGDSLGVKVMDGKTLVVYKMGAGETAYAVSRKYGISFKDLAAANAGVDMGALKVGQEILVPVNNGIVPTPSTAKAEPKTEPAPKVTAEKENPKPTTSNEKIVAVPVTEKKEEIKKEMEGTAAQPDKSAPAVSQTTNSENVLSTTDLNKETSTPSTDKSKSFAQLYAEYMSEDMIAASEKGVATWIENNGIEAGGDRFYVLHNSAPVGSIVKIRNLMNNRIIYAKVIGSLSESEVQEKVLVKLSAGAAERLNVLDNRFVVEITYYLPDDQAMK